MPLPIFIEERLPENITYGSGGGPMFSTAVFGAASGEEQRNSLWEDARRKYDIAYGIRDKADMDLVLSFFMNVRGRAIGFRMKDWADYQLIDEQIGIGNSSRTAFQITKTYSVGAYSTVRQIKKPLDGSVTSVTVNGVPTVAYTIDYTTGIITFTTAPPTGHAIVINCEFDVPVRFDTDELPLVHEAYLQESLSSIPVVELRVS